MNRNEFLRRARRYARNNGLDYGFNSDRGKGGHIQVSIGELHTFVPEGEIRTGTLFSILKDLNINPRRF